MLLAALVRLPTLGLQSFWFDEAFTPVHVLHGSLISTLETTAHTENTPPLWYVVIWVWTRIFGTGAFAMRLPSALAGIALVAVGWQIAGELAGRRATIATGALIAVNPLFVWYSQEARSYGLYTLTAALAILCFIRAERRPSARTMAAFALAGCLALLSHYFAVFMLVPMALWLLRDRAHWRAAAGAVGAIAIVGAALVPLVLTQGGNGTQWIGKSTLASRVQEIPQYYLTGYSGAPLGHGIELLVALPLIAGVIYGLRRGLGERERRGALCMLALSACGILIPVFLAAAGADYLAPRNLIAAMVPVTVLLAIVIVPARAGRTGAAFLVLAAVAMLAICVDVNLSPRLQRGDWSAVGAAIRRAPAAPPPPVARRSIGSVHYGALGAAQRPVAVIATHLASAPLEYYWSALREVGGRDARLVVSEIDKVGYMPLLPSASTPPAPGFRLVAKRNFEGQYLYRFLAPRPASLAASVLLRDGITAGETNLLASSSAAGS